jgi:hypothetical protein
VSSSHIDGNHVADFGGVRATGGGISFLGRGSGATVSITDSTLSSNSAVSDGLGGDARGGGLFAEPDSTAGAALDTVEVTRTDLVGNGAGVPVGDASGAPPALAFGGAIFAETASGLTLRDSRVASSSIAISVVGNLGGEAHGGGIYSSGPLALVSSSVTSGLVAVEAGEGSATGGGIEQAGPGELTLTRSTVDGNRLRLRGGTGPIEGRGAGIDSATPASVASSTVSRNRIDVSSVAADLALGFGAGLFLTGDGHSIRNSTVAGNIVHAEATDPGGSAVAAGGGVLSSAGGAAFVQATVAANAISAAGATAFAGGGGVFAGGDPLSLQATILAANTAAEGPDCDGDVASSGHNLIGHSTDCTIIGQKPNDRLDVAPKLAALADNGGPTRTVAPFGASPAIDQIPAMDCAIKVDQRGVKRPQGPRCDIGAFERKP